MNLEKVTAGLPSLSPYKRDRITAVDRTRSQDAINLRKKIADDEATIEADGGVDTTHAGVQLGHPLSPQDLMTRLRKMNSNLIFEVSKNYPELQGIYIMAWKPNINGEMVHVKDFICGFENSYMPEFSVRHFKTERVPDPTITGHWREIRTFTHETRGWRTVLARLLRRGLIREPDIARNFDFSRDSRNWQRLTA